MHIHRYLLEFCYSVRQLGEGRLLVLGVISGGNMEHSGRRTIKQSVGLYV